MASHGIRRVHAAVPSTGGSGAWWPGGCGGMPSAMAGCSWATAQPDLRCQPARLLSLPSQLALLACLAHQRPAPRRRVPLCIAFAGRLGAAPDMLGGAVGTEDAPAEHV